MNALVWTGESFELQEVSTPEPGPQQVLLQVETTAICGSDLHLKDFGARPPVIPGHEAAGTVAALGSGVHTPAIGDRVAANPVQVCGRCYCCTHKLTHLCLNTRHLGGREVPGTWAEYVSVDAVNCFAIPNGVGFTAAALSEPAAVCTESFRRAGLRSDQSVVIVGDGPFGFMHAQVARARGVERLWVAGHYDTRLQRIKALTGAEICNSRQQGLKEMVLEREPAGVDLVIEVTGSGAAPVEGLRLLKPRGTLVLFSYIWKPEMIDMGLIHMKELNILGSCRSLDAFADCLQMMADKKIDTEALIDIAVPLVEHERAFAALSGNKAEIFKAVLLPRG